MCNITLQHLKTPCIISAFLDKYCRYLAAAICLPIYPLQDLWILVAVHWVSSPFQLRYMWTKTTSKGKIYPHKALRQIYPRKTDWIFWAAYWFWLERFRKEHFISSNHAIVCKYYQFRYSWSYCIPILQFPICLEKRY